MILISQFSSVKSGLMFLLFFWALVESSVHHLQRSKLDVREVRAASEVQGHGLERGQQDKAMQRARVLEEGAVT